MSWGRVRWVLEMADWTSCAASSMLRLKANWRVIELVLWLLVEVIAVTPGVVLFVVGAGSRCPAPCRRVGVLRARCCASEGGGGGKGCGTRVAGGIVGGCRGRGRERSLRRKGEQRATGTGSRPA